MLNGVLVLGLDNTFLCGVKCKQLRFRGFSDLMMTWQQCYISLSITFFFDGCTDVGLLSDGTIESSLI